MKNDLNFNQICGKIIKDARESKNISIEDLAFYLIPKKDENIKENNLEIDHQENEIEIINESVENSYLRKKVFENEELQNIYKENIKKINYWEKGNGFPDLNEIYKLAEVIDIDPNEIYKYRELGRKNLKGENTISKWKYYRNRVIDENLESLKLLFPALIGAILFWFVFSKDGAEIVHQIISVFRQIFVATH